MKANDSLFIRACMGKHIERHPVWFMRQAGRYLPDYSKIKAGRNVLDVQNDPYSSSEITVLPVKKLGVDAAVLYSDIMIPIRSTGYDVRIDENVGPVTDSIIKEPEDLELLEGFDCDKNAQNVLENIRQSKQKLPEGIPLIGFSGAPFTLMSYLFEGKPSRTFENCINAMENYPELWKKAMEVAVKMDINYLKAQIRTGVDAIQLFDSWAGLLSSDRYVKYVLPYTRKVFEGIPNSVPKIHFSAKSSTLIEEFAKTGCSVISVGTDMGIKEAYERLNGKFALQGNMNPESASAGGEIMRHEATEILKEMETVNKFIFNLGHGVLKDTNPDNLVKIVDIVKSSPIMTA